MTRTHIIITSWQAYALGAVLVLGLAAYMIARAATPMFMGAVDGAYTSPPSGGDLARRYTVINGWAVPADIADALATVRVTTDAAGFNVVDEFETSIARQDVYSALGTMLHVGFSWRIPSSYRDGQQRTFYFWGVRQVAGQTLTQQVGEWPTDRYDGGLRGSVDAAMGTVVQGWAFDLDGEDVAHQALPVSIYLDGEFVAATIANIERQDLVSAFPLWSVGAWHGYNVSLDIPARFRDGALHGVEVFGLEYTEGVMTKIGETNYRIIDAQGTMGSLPTM